MSGGVVRLAGKQVNASKEIFYGLALGLAVGGVWRAWHLSYKAKVDDYYKSLEEASSK